jgi:hypothetical protein
MLEVKTVELYSERAYPHSASMRGTLARVDPDACNVCIKIFFDQDLVYVQLR